MNTPTTHKPRPAPGRAPAEQPASLSEDLEDGLLEIAPYAVTALVATAAVVAAILVTAAHPAWLNWLAASFSGAQPKAYWYMSRSAAIIGFIMLWASVALGLGITNKMARAWPGGPTYNALHEHTAWLGLILTAFHGFILLFDGYIGLTLTQLLVPFASANYRPLWVGLGQIAFYLLVLVVLSFYVRRWMGYRVWRTLHYLSFAVFGLGLLHGVLSGTDTAGLPMLAVYWLSVVSVAGLLTYRIQTARENGRRKASAPANLRSARPG